MTRNIRRSANRPKRFRARNRSARRELIVQNRAVLFDDPIRNDQEQAAYESELRAEAWRRRQLALNVKLRFMQHGSHLPSRRKSHFNVLRRFVKSLKR